MFENNINSQPITDAEKKILRNAILPLVPLEVKYKSQGNIYLVDGPEDFELLDWDATMPEQSKQVLDKLKEAELYLNDDETGEDLYRRLQKQFGGKKEGERLASMALNEAGIPGHRFWDAFSRDDKIGTHNFVIWNTDTLRLLGISEGSDEEAQDYFRNEDYYYAYLDSLDNDSDVLDYSSNDYEREFNNFANGLIDATEDDGFSEVYHQIGKGRKNEMNAALIQHRPDLTAEQRADAISEIEKLGESIQAGGYPKVEKIATYWLLKGHIILPEDNYKILDAIKISKQQHLNPMSFDDPNEILAKYTIKPTNASLRINPDTVPEFSDKVDYGNGITVYTVDDTKEGQLAVRHIIDTHWGKDANPWCLTARLNGDKEELERAWYFWNDYSEIPKRIAFRNGKLLAFCASDYDEVEWWDREDISHSGIPYVAKRNGSETECEFDEETRKTRKVKQTNPDKSEYYRHDNEQLKSVSLPDRSEYEWFDNGQLYTAYVPKEIKYTWNENGQLNSAILFDRAEYLWHDNGLLKNITLLERVSFSGPQEIIIPCEKENFRWYENGTLQIGENNFNKTRCSWYENGTLKSVRLPDGIGYEFDDNGQLKEVTHYEGIFCKTYSGEEISQEMREEFEKSKPEIEKLQKEFKQRASQLKNNDTDFEQQLQAITQEAEQLQAQFDQSNGESYNQIIGSKGAKNLDKANGNTILMDNLHTAKKMAKDGKSVKTIRSKTGWEKGHDGKWKYEISYGNINNDISKNGILNPNRNKCYTLENVFDAPELFKAYPELLHYPVFFDDFSGRSFFDRHAKEFGIDINMSAEEAREALIHEIQHAIQHIEGFALSFTTPSTSSKINVGKLTWKHWDKKAKSIWHSLSPSEQGLWKYLVGRINYEFNADYRFADDIKHDILSKYLNKKQQQLFLDWNEARFYAREKKYYGEHISGFNAHWRSSGEVEARNAGRRASLTALDMASTLLAGTEDFMPHEGQIIRQINDNGHEVFNQKFITSKASNHTINENEAMKLDKDNGNSNLIDNLHTAKKMAGNGSNANAIREKTGWLKGTNGKWLYEFPISTNNSSEVYHQTARPVDDFLLTPDAHRQVEAVRKQYEGTSKWLKAPNGQKTKLSELQWLLVRTPNFKAWFGDWENQPENSSKILDKNGEPLVVYRGVKPPLGGNVKLPGILKKSFL